MIGGLGSTTINAGRVSNKGWEFSVNLAKSLGDWELSLFGGISKNKNKITKLVSGPYDNGSTIHQEGHPLNSFSDKNGVDHCCRKVILRLMLMGL